MINKAKKQKLVLLIRWILIVFLLIILFWVLINYYIIIKSQDYIFDSKHIPKNNIKIGLVLWASVKSNWIPSPILQDRLLTAFYQYKLWDINKIIVSGDNSQKNYNEPQAMKNYLVELWVKSEDIYLDYAWFDTYDSIYRAKEIFWVNSLEIFTQRYHLYRSVYIARSLWINAIWVVADKKNLLSLSRFDFREFFSRIKAFLEVEILKTKPKFLGEKIKIK